MIFTLNRDLLTKTVMKTNETVVLLALRRFGTVEVIQISDLGEQVPQKQTIFVTSDVNDDVCDWDHSAEKETVEKRLFVIFRVPIQTVYIIGNPITTFQCLDRD